jgi:hypothetical protein
MRPPKIEKWVLTPHAVERMEERHITLAEVREILSDPEECMSQGPKWILAKSFRGRTDNLIAAVALERKDRNLWVNVTLMVRFEAGK